MPQEKGFSALLLLLLVAVVAAVAGFYFLSGKKTLPATIKTSATESSSLKTEYANPFDQKSTTTTNPFDSSEYQNPFDNLK